MSQEMESIPTASPWVVKFAGQVPAGGKILDLACGGGRHARWFLAHGYRVLAVDRDVAKLDDLQGDANIEILEYDLEADFWPFLEHRFDGIIVTNYLHRPLFPHLVSSLATGGILIYETFTVGQERFGKPSNPNFLLRDGELIRFFSQKLEILAHETMIDQDPGPAKRQRIAAIKKTHLVD